MKSIKSISQQIIFIGTLYFGASLFMGSVGFPVALSFPRNYEKLQLKGHIKFMTIYAYEMSKDTSGTYFDTLVDKTFILFHKTGNISSSEIYPIKYPHAPFERCEYFCRFDSKQRLAEMDINYFLNDFRKYQYKYDNQNREIEAISFHGELMDDSITFTYQEKIVIRSHFQYNKGNAVQYILAKKDTLLYDPVFKNYAYLPFRYKKINTNLEQTIVSDRDSVITLFDSRMNKIESSEFRFSNKLQTHFFYSYDKHGNIISKIAANKQNSTTTHHYLYDPKGNWTMDSIFTNDKLNSIFKRVIEYQ